MHEVFNALTVVQMPAHGVIENPLATFHSCAFTMPPAADTRVPTVTRLKPPVRS